MLRDRGHFVSTASVIEAQRLGTALAALRDRPAPGFEELREAAIACLCGGERALWNDVAAELLIGAGVGSIPAAAPLAPLLEDLQRQQKATRLKPEALERALTLDLRSDSGLMRSTLLHRLAALDVPWGRLTDAGRSRGTFRENWQLCWEPEFAVRLVEHLVYGSTIAEAAAGRVMEAMRSAGELVALAALTRSAMVADLAQAVEFGVAALEEKAALTGDCQALLSALPPMADILRYGEARAGTVEHLATLMPRIVVQASLALPYAARATWMRRRRASCAARSSPPRRYSSPSSRRMWCRLARRAAGAAARRSATRRRRHRRALLYESSCSPPSKPPTCCSDARRVRRSPKRPGSSRASSRRRPAADPDAACAAGSMLADGARRRGLTATCRCSAGCSRR